MMTIMLEVLKRDGSKRIYTAHEGSYVEVQGLSSGNSYWHSVEHYRPMEGDRVLRCMRLCLTNDAGDVVGYYNGMYGIRELFNFYLREPILSEVEV